MAPAELLDDQARVWRWLAILGAATLAGLLAMGFEIRWASTAAPVVGGAFLHATSRFYRSVRRDDRLAATCEALAQLVVFTMIAVPLSSLAAAFGGPLLDDRFARLDAALGLDWRAYLAAIDSVPSFGRLLRLAYDTLLPQLALILLLLGFTNRLGALRTLVWATGLSGVAAIALSAALPAIGYYAYLGLTPADYPHLDPSAPLTHVMDFIGVRDGSHRSIDLAGLKGIITFPSFHAALATLYAWAFWQHRASRWPGLAVEALVVLATPIDGGHYFVDVAAGIVLALLAIRAARHIVGHTAVAPAALATPAGTPRLTAAEAAPAPRQAPGGSGICPPS
jgi:hypothetical protein